MEDSSVSIVHTRKRLRNIIRIYVIRLRLSITYKANTLVNLALPFRVLYSSLIARNLNVGSRFEVYDASVELAWENVAFAFFDAGKHLPLYATLETIKVKILNPCT